MTNAAAYKEVFQSVTRQSDIYIDWDSTFSCFDFEAAIIFEDVSPTVLRVTIDLGEDEAAHGFVTSNPAYAMLAAGQLVATVTERGYKMITKPDENEETQPFHDLHYGNGIQMFFLKA